MAEPITISGQTFVKTDKGWVDKKTKVVAPEGLITLLERMSTGEPVKKLRVKIDRSRGPVTISGQKYVFDSNQNAWVTDDAMRWRPPDSMQRVIEEALKQTLGENADQIVSKMGTVGQIAKSSVKKPGATGSGTIKTPVNIKINSPIVSMIEKLATIDGYLKQRLDNQKKIAARNLAATKESAIEASPTDASPVQNVKVEDAEKSNSGQMAAALLIGGLLASQFEPVQDAFKSLADGVKGVWNFVSNVAKTIADGLDMFTGKSSTSTNTSTTAKPITPSTGQNNLQPSEPTPVDAPSQGVPSEPNKVDASPVPSTPTEPNQAVPAQQSSGSTRMGRTLVGAAVGGAIAGPVGAAIGGAVGFLSAPRQSSSTPSSPSAASSGSPAPSSSTPAQSSSSSSAPSSSSTPSGDATQQKSSQTPDASKINGTNYDGLIMKNFDENTGGGPAAENTIKFAKIVQPGLGNMFKRFTAFNDRFHQGITSYTSPHTKGIAFDLTVNNPSQAGAASNKIKELADKNKFKVTVLNEYANPTAMSTGGHIHVTVHGPGVGSTVRGGTGVGEPGGDGSSAIGAAASAVWDIGKGAIKSIGDIISAGLGPMESRSITDSLMQAAPNTAGEIATAALNKNAAVADLKTPALDTTAAVIDPPNLNKNSNVDFVQNPPSASDMSSVDYYFIRMGIREGYDAMAGMRA